jgi:pyruvate,orthophosphate dikinase
MLRLAEPTRTLQIADTRMREGDVLTLDSGDGAVYAGAVQTVVEPLVELQARLAKLRAQ